MFMASVFVVAAALAAETFPIPSPETSTVPQCVAACPAGDAAFARVVVRDQWNFVLRNVTVVLDLSACDAFTPCPACGDPVDEATMRYMKFTNSLGVALFQPCSGGGCSGAAVQVTADGVPLNRTGPGSDIAYGSADQDGNLQVDQSDVDAVQSKIGTGDLSGDLDCNQVVNAADVDIVMAHFGHACPEPTPVDRSTWGRVKAMYR